MTTTDYSKFQFLTFNRSVKDGKVKNLIDSISRIGYIKSESILVDENFFIIDGQHRFMACKFLGLPILYECKEANIDNKEAMLLLNKNQHIWRLQEYADAWANLGVAFYVECVAFEKKYKLGASNTFTILNINKNGNKIREGFDYPINPNKDRIADFILLCKIVEFYKDKNFVGAVTKLFSLCTDAQILKIRNNILAVRKQADTQMYLRCFENILNKNSKNKTVLAK